MQQVNESKLQRSISPHYLNSYYRLAHQIIKNYGQRLQFLGSNFRKQTEILINVIYKQIQTVLLDTKMKSQLSKNMEEQQKRFILNERISSLQKELEKLNGSSSHDKDFKHSN
jgi:ATP-dependent Lon protease